MVCRVASALRQVLPGSDTLIEVHGLLKKLWKIISVSVSVAVVAVALYIMLNGLGLVDGLDFGAGAYYYADIPDFDKYMHDGAFVSRLPLWVYIVLFLAWGYLMWRLWLWIEGRNK